MRRYKIKSKMIKHSIKNLFSNTNSIQFWDSRFNKKGNQKGRIKYYLDIIPYINKNCNSLLELGCGVGAGLIELQRILPKIKYSGCDFSKKGIEIAKKDGKNIDFFQLDITKGVTIKKYDCIICISVLEHITNYKKVIESWLKICKYLIIKVPFNERVKYFGLKPSSHIHRFKEETLNEYRPILIAIKNKRITYIIKGKLN